MYDVINISHFSFRFTSPGHYLVTLVCPRCNRVWSRSSHDMQLIDKTKNCDYPSFVNLHALAAFVMQPDNEEFPHIDCINF